MSPLQSSAQSAPTVMSLVESSFKNATPKWYWHYVAKTCPKESNFTSQTIKERIKRIAEKLGGNSFQLQDEHGFTPLHVAVITGNAACVSFLFRQQVNAEIKDKSGKSAIDYAHQYHPELLNLFIFPHKLKNKIASVIEPVLTKWLVKLPQMKGCYQENTDDFGREIRGLFIGKPIPDRQSEDGRLIKGNQQILADLALVCKQLGIEVKFSETVSYARDLRVRLHTGGLLQPLLQEQQPDAVARSNSFSLYFNKSAFTRTKNPYFKCFTGNTFSTLVDWREQISKELNEKEVSTPSFYFEGGNVFTVTNSLGKIKVAIGRDHRINAILLMYLGEHFKRFSDAAAWEFGPKSSSKLIPSKIQKVAEYLYAQGLLQQEGHSGFLNLKQCSEVMELERSLQFTSSADSKAHSYREIAEKKGLLRPFKWDKEMEKTYRDKVIEYQALKYACNDLISTEFELNLGDVHHISQAGYHLDLFLKPGPNHMMFIQDYELCVEILQALYDQLCGVKKGEVEKKQKEDVDVKSPEIDKKQKEGDFGLSKIDQDHLYRYLVTAKKMHAEMGPLLNKVKQELAKAGFKTIPMPGLLMYENENCQKDLSSYFTDSHNVNFMNALSGWSQSKEQYYYITTGCQVGDCLGGVLMDIFALYLQQYVPNIETYFVGRDKNQPEAFSEPMSWWNRNDVTAAGVHCFTFETTTADHKPEMKK